MFGVRVFSLAYLVHTNKEPEYGDNPPDLLSVRAHCSEFGLVEKEIIQRFHHCHIQFEQYNGTPFENFAISLAHSPYITVLSRFRVNSNGIGVFLAFKAEFAGKVF